MPSVTWLHLTDFHFGAAEQEWLWPTVAGAFDRDLTGIRKKCGPIDVVLFTGDLTQRGSPEEFSGFQKTIDRLLDVCESWGDPRPRLLAVPGNHDLQRPNEAARSSPDFLVLRNWDTIPEVRDAFWTRSDSGYRKLVHSAFDAYDQWWSRVPRQGLKYTAGMLPGDFSASFEKDGLSIGIVGLNSSFLQLSEGDYRGRLAIHRAQMNAVTENDPPRWVDQHHFSFLLTHHPPDWLSQSSLDAYRSDIAPSGRFGAHIFGHMHEGVIRNLSTNGGPVVRQWQGSSMFGLEHWGERVSRVHGYSVGRLEAKGTAAKLQIWPRKLHRRADGAWQMIADPEHALTDRASTHPESFKLPRPVTRKPATKSVRNRVEERVAPPVAAPAAPEVVATPVADFATNVQRLFVGREEILDDIQQMVEATVGRSRIIAAPARSDVQLIWLHGFGGMGKSWMLRRAYVDALGRDDLYAALIDWDSPVWRTPLKERPLFPEQMFDTIAHRVAARYGASTFDAYWQAKREVAANAETHEKLAYTFDEALDGLTHENAPPDADRVARQAMYHLRGVLEAADLWSEDLKRRRANVAFVRRRRPLRATLFEAWSQKCAAPPSPAVANPNRLLAETLRSSIQKALKQKPLLLLLDTCEVLPELLDWWLRELLVPLIDGCESISIIMGSRRPPDAFDAGPRRGWLNETSRRQLRVIPFAEHVRFNVHEIERALALSTPHIANDDLAEDIHRVTLGVPLAVTMLLDEIRSGTFTPDELASLEVEAAAGPKATRSVIEVVAKRFLLHLEGIPGREDDLRDIVALSLLPRADSRVLTTFWSTSDWQARLDSLANRYALCAEGDVHPTVRHFLQRKWRESTPNHVRLTAAALLQAIEQTPQEEKFGSPAHLEWLLERATTAIWAHGDSRFSMLARAVAVAVAFDFPLSVSEAVSHLPVTNELHRRILEILENRWTFGVPPPEVIGWLDRTRGADWDPEERACVDLSVALASAVSAPAEAILAFERAFEIFGEHLPRRYEVGKTYMTTVFKVTVDTEKVDLVERAIAWADKLHFAGERLFREYGHLFHNVKRYDDAVAMYRRGGEEGNAEAYGHMAHIYSHHLGDPAAAVAALKKGLALSPDFAELWLRLAQAHLLLDQLDEAEAALSHRSVTVRADEDYYTLLAKLRHLQKRDDEAAELIVRAAAVVKTDTDRNELAWRLYEMDRNLDLALGLATRALENADDPNTRHTRWAILVRMRDFSAAEGELTRLLRTQHPTVAWRSYPPVFAEIARGGAGESTASLLDQAGPRWKYVADALRQATPQDVAAVMRLPEPAA